MAQVWGTVVGGNFHTLPPFLAGMLPFGALPCQRNQLLCVGAGRVSVDIWNKRPLWRG